MFITASCSSGARLKQARCDGERIHQVARWRRRAGAHQVAQQQLERLTSSFVSVADLAMGWSQVARDTRRCRRSDQPPRPHQRLDARVG